MNVYGYTKCPECNASNSMYRPLENILPAWDLTKCWNCKFEFKHSEFNKQTIGG